jgi:hypothetical protein
MVFYHCFKDIFKVHFCYCFLIVTILWAHNGHTLEEKAKITDESNIKSKHYCGSNSAVARYKDSG